MALSWNTLQAIPRLTTYEEASKHEAAVKPIRGREPAVKPLGRRSHWHQAIRRETNGDICIHDYNGPLVVFRPNGDVLLYDCGWSQKASEREIITEVTGIPLETFDGKMWTHTSNGQHHLRPSPRRRWNGEKWVEPTEPHPENIFRRVEHTAGDRTYMAWVYTNPPASIVHHVNRKGMRDVRQHYAPFIKYATAMDSLRKDNPPQPEEYVEPFGVLSSTDWKGNVVYTWWGDNMPSPVIDRYGRHMFTHGSAAQLCEMMLSDDPSTHYKAYLWFSVREHNREFGTPALIDRVLMMNHYAEALKPVECNGKAKDRYAWAVPK